MSWTDEDFTAWQTSMDEREAAFQALLGEFDEQMAAASHRSEQIDRRLGAQVALLRRASRAVDALGEYPADPTADD